MLGSSACSTISLFLITVLVFVERLQTQTAFLAVEYSSRLSMRAHSVRLEVLTAVSINIMVFRNVDGGSCRRNPLFHLLGKQIASFYPSILKKDAVGSFDIFVPFTKPLSVISQKTINVVNFDIHKAAFPWFFNDVSQQQSLCTI